MNGAADPRLEPAEPVAANPGVANSDGAVDKPNIGVGYAAVATLVFVPFLLRLEPHKPVE